MKNLSDKLSQQPFWVSLFLILFIHIGINIITGFVYFLNEFSIESQIVHSIIHLSFLALVIKFLYTIETFTDLSKKIALSILVIIIILNCIPYSQGLNLYDNGFVPMWAQIPQTQFGWPNIFLRFFHSGVEEFGVDPSKDSLHFNTFSLNLYIISLLIIVELKFISHFQAYKARKSSLK